MTPPRLVVVALGEIPADPGLPEWLAQEIRRITGDDAVVAPSIPLADRWRHDGTARYDSNFVVDALVHAVAPEGRPEQPGQPNRALAITQADLTAPGRDFVFGEATLGGPCAVISIARLLSPHPERLRHRALKLAAHELGHLDGFQHCSDPACVMYPSSDLQDTDAKSERLCAACSGPSGRHRPP